MLDLKNIINNQDEVKAKLKTRGFDISIIDKIIELSKERSIVMTAIQELEAKRNKLSKEIGMVKSKGGDISAILSEVAKIKVDIEKIKEQEATVNSDVHKLLLIVPNLPGNTTPVGKDESSNVIMKSYLLENKGQITEAHYDIAVRLDIVDFERATKLSGSRYWIYKGHGAKLVRALKDFMLDEHISKGYLEMLPPVIVNTKTMQGTGQLPKFEEDLYKLEGKDAWLIPTAEVPLTNYYSGEIIDLTKPVMLTAYTPCFRSEAGSGGKDMRGLIRAHQFNKVELVKLTTKEDAYEEYLKTINDARSILDLLELPHQSLQLCTGDVGFSAAETVDLEVWLPSENTFREISSVSYFGDFQGRRASIRYRDENGKTQTAHTINGSSLAIDRTIAAILENYLQEDGSVKIPKVLVPYMGIEFIK